MNLDTRLHRMGVCAAVMAICTAAAAGDTEIEDHAVSGRNMDTRTPASQCRFVG